MEPGPAPPGPDRSGGQAQFVWLDERGIVLVLGLPYPGRGRRFPSRCSGAPRPMTWAATMPRGRAGSSLRGPAPSDQCDVQQDGHAEPDTEEMPSSKAVQPMTIVPPLVANRVGQDLVAQPFKQLCRALVLGCRRRGYPEDGEVAVRADHRRVHPLDKFGRVQCAPRSRHRYPGGHDAIDASGNGGTALCVARSLQELGDGRGTGRDTLCFATSDPSPTSLRDVQPMQVVPAPQRVRLSWALTYATSRSRGRKPSAVSAAPVSSESPEKE